MSLGELVNELKGTIDNIVEEKRALELKNKLGGQVSPEGDIKLDTADLSKVAARLKEVRAKVAVLKKEETQLKALVLSHPKAKAGYNDGNIEIEGTLEIDLGNPELLAVLMETKTFASCCNLTLSQPKVRDLAAVNSKVQAAIRTLKGRRIKSIK